MTRNPLEVNHGRYLIKLCPETHHKTVGLAHRPDKSRKGGATVRTDQESVFGQVASVGGGCWDFG